MTVDMIATGTDVRPLECVFFMRSVKSRTYFEQMKGRGVRVIDAGRLPGGHARRAGEGPVRDRRRRRRHRDRPRRHASRSTASRRSRSNKLLQAVSFGIRDPDVVSTIAGRLARLDRRLTSDDRDGARSSSPAMSLQRPHARDRRGARPRPPARGRPSATGKEEPDADEIAAATKQLLDAAVAPLATNPELRERLVEIRRSYEQVIDEVSADELIEAGYSQGRDRPGARDRRVVRAVHRGEPATRSPPSRSSTAARTRSGSRSRRSRSSRTRSASRRASGRPSGSGRPTRRSTARRSAAPAGASSPTSSRSSASPSTQDDELVPFPERVARALPRLAAPAGERRPRRSRAEQLAWLERIRDTIAASLGISRRRLIGYPPFAERGGLGKARRDLRRRARPAARRAQRGARGVSELPPGWAAATLGEVVSDARARAIPQRTPQRELAPASRTSDVENVADDGRDRHVGAQLRRATRRSADRIAATFVLDNDWRQSASSSARPRASIWRR